MSWALRLVFVALIILTVGSKLATSQRPNKSGDAASAIAAVLGERSAGPVTGHAWSNSISIYSASVSRCAAPLIVVTAPPDFSATSILLQMQRTGDHHLFAYRDWVSDHPDRWTVLRIQLWRKALSIVGHDRGVNTDKLLFIAEPQDCTVADSLPWRRFWIPA